MRMLVKWLDGLAARERLMVCAGGVLVIAVLSYGAVLDPLMSRYRHQQREARARAELLATLHAQEADVQRQLNGSPDEAIRRQIEQVRTELQRVDGELGGLQRELLRPETMAGVLQKLIGADGGVRLVSLRNLPPTRLGERNAADKDVRRSGAVYRHGVEIAVEGSYAELVDYLQRLEQQPWHLYWGKTKLSADYPKATLTVTLYTLSLDAVWLTV